MTTPEQPEPFQPDAQFGIQAQQEEINELRILLNQARDRVAYFNACLKHTINEAHTEIGRLQGEISMLRGELAEHESHIGEHVPPQTDDEPGE